MNHDVDVLVIGGGPAGATTSALLAEKGWDVLVLEKEQFPRYHVGESLMPFCYFTLEQLGVIDWLKNSACPKKHSVQFVTEDGKLSKPFYFFQHLDHEASTTWQVKRDEFDAMMLDNAEKKGAQVKYGVRAEKLLKVGGKVVGAVARNGGDPFEVKAKMVIDASGRDVFSMSRSGWRVKDPVLNKIAIWTYYQGAKRDEGLDEGATTVAYLPERGWFWYIPLQNNRVSVGIVAEKDYLYRDGKDPANIFAREIENNAWIKDHLAQGTCENEYWATGDYSYRSQYCATDGLLLVGDAYAFLDPVFSSGVFLALSSGALGAKAVDKALKSGNVEATQFMEYGERMCHGIESMRRLVYAFYDPNFSFATLLKEQPELRGDLTDCLIGDLFERDFSHLFQTIGRMANTPEPLKHGRAYLNAA
ncbi:MAG: NAD(P)/FAD-dependent oxidoreductase [Verrucomicrobiota bacterium]